jgi:dihydropyrimidinase
MTLLIKNGEIVTATDRYVADVLVDGETIAAIGRGMNVQADRTIDATGLYVMPGGIDVHTHMDLPFGGTNASDDFETGTVAAAFGGTTTIIDFAVQGMGEPLQKAYEVWRQKAEGKVAIDYALHMIVRDMPEVQLGDMDEMVREGVTSFKLFMAVPRRLPGRRRDDLPRAQAHGRQRRLHLHARRERRRDRRAGQEGAARRQEGAEVPRAHAPAEAEGEATGRAIALSEMAGVPIYIVHLSAAHALKKVSEARSKGLPPTPRPARSTCSSPTTTTRSPASTARSTSCRRRCARSGTRTSCGRASRPTTCRWSRPTTARSA